MLSDNFDGFYNDFNYESVDTLNGVEVVFYNFSQQEYNVSVSRSHPDELTLVNQNRWISHLHLKYLIRNR